jgi:carboxymethylenebutenolidase
MDIADKTVELHGGWQGYLAWPRRVEQPLPGIVLIQEVWGVDEHIRDVAHRLVAAGYAVLAPDLYTLGGPRPAQLSEPRVAQAKRFMDSVPASAWATMMDPARREDVLKALEGEERLQIGETIGLLMPPDRAARLPAQAEELGRASQWLREHVLCQGRKIGAIGFCVGGSLAALMALRDAQLGGTVMFYGAPPPFDKLGTLQSPILGLFGEEDPRLIPQLPGFERAMKDAQKSLEVRVYPKTPHAFFNDTRSSYRPEAARDAWAQTLRFFATTLS